MKIIWFELCMQKKKEKKEKDIDTNLKRSLGNFSCTFETKLVCCFPPTAKCSRLQLDHAVK